MPQIEFTQEMFALLLGWYAVFLVTLTLHEGAHALVAWRLGDPTAYYGGQVTLNPGPHIAREPVGTILVPLVTFLWMGWMMGWASAPYDPYWAIRHPKRAVLMALAGPTANLLLLLLAMAVLAGGLSAGYFRLPTPDELQTNQFDVTQRCSHILYGADEGPAQGMATLASIFFSLNLLLLLFNLVPIPPLDGSALWRLVLPQEMFLRFQHFMSQPMFAILGLIVAIRVFSQFYWPWFDAAVSLVYSAAT